MEFAETKLHGAHVVRLKKIEDNRGYFARSWCRNEFIQHGLNPNIVQLNVGFSHRRGTLRGMHYQKAPHAEAKYVSCTRGAIYDVIIDLRPESRTFQQWIGVELTANNGLLLFAPEGFAHGYQTLTDDAEMQYMTTAMYEASSATGVRYNDSTFGIQWPLPVSVVSKPDQEWPDYHD